MKFTAVSFITALLAMVWVGTALSFRDSFSRRPLYWQPTSRNVFYPSANSVGGYTRPAFHETARQPVSPNEFHPSAHPMDRFALPAFRDTSRMAETPYLTYFTPTFKCPGGYYCRAELTAYKEFEGKTSIVVGYSVWSFSSDSVPIPQYTIDSILGTTDSEINSYINVLAPLIFEYYQYPDQLCPVSPHEALEGYRKAINNMVNCAKTSNYLCRQEVSVGRCP